MPTLFLKPGREKSLLRRHPWVFAGAVAHVEGKPAAGATVALRAANGAFLAWAACSPASQLVARVWSFEERDAIDAAWFQERLRRAWQRRAAALAEPEGAARLVYAESDGLPGLIVDRYADRLVCQFLTAGVEAWRGPLVEALAALHPCAGIYERSDAEVRAKEGLAPRTGVLTGDAPPETVTIREGASRYLVDLAAGHKTGFYLDQRVNRAALAGWARDAEVLNAFAYTGGFGVAALQGGARHVVNLDTSRPALELAARNLALNDLDPARAEQAEGDVFTVLRGYRDRGRQFDLIVLDPPKFVESRVQLERGCRGYKDINLLAFKLLRPGGVLFTFSCSGLVDRSLFEKIVADAALDARRDAQVVTWLTQAPDHPVLLSFPEAAYLKGLVCRVA